MRHETYGLGDRVCYFDQTPQSTDDLGTVIGIYPRSGRDEIRVQWDSGEVDWYDRRNIITENDIHLYA